MKLGAAIEKCRLYKGLTKSKLAQEAGISVSYLTLITNGTREPSLSSLEKLSSALGIPVSLLIFLGSDDEELTSISGELRDELKRITGELIKESSERTFS